MSEIVRESRAKYWLEYPMTKEEREQAAREAAIAINEIELLEFEMKAHIRPIKEDIKALKFQAKDRAKAFEKGRDQGEVAVELVYDLERRMKWVEFRGGIYNKGPLDLFEVDRLTQHAVPKIKHLRPINDEDIAEAVSSASSEIGAIWASETNKKTKKDHIG